ncbi:hypothetical protein ACROYT_G013211 [Oculina patagonica]
MVPSMLQTTLHILVSDEAYHELRMSLPEDARVMIPSINALNVERNRKILKIHWPEKISNKELWSRTGQEHIPTEIARRKWAWIGHTLRKPGTDTTKQALKWNPQGKRKVGRPAKTWRRSTEEELKKANISWNAAEKAAANRVRWRSIVDALCSTRSLNE